MSSTRGASVIADRYARALLEVALEQKSDVDAIGDELDGFVRLLQKNPDLSRALSTTTIALSKRLAVLDAVVEKTGQGQPTKATRNVLRLLITKERIGLCDVVAAQYRRALDDYNRVAAGDVVSAEQLTDQQRQDLSRRLGEVTGRTMQLTYRVDPTIVGGLVIRVGNRVYDASITRQLAQFKEDALTAI